MRAIGGGDAVRSTTPACFESVKALGQKICRDARRLRTQVAVAAWTSDELAHDQQCPALPEHIEPIGDRTVLVVVTPPGHSNALSLRQISIPNS